MKNNKFLILVLLFFSCNSTAISKPKSLPKEAIWKGGADGGCWFLFKSSTNTNIEVIVYHENGEVWQKGFFVKSGDCNIQPNKIIDEVTGFDGEKILTRTNCYYKK